MTWVRRTELKQYQILGQFLSGGYFARLDLKLDFNNFKLVICREIKGLVIQNEEN